MKVLKKCLLICIFIFLLCFNVILINQNKELISNVKDLKSELYSEFDKLEEHYLDIIAKNVVLEEKIINLEDTSKNQYSETKKMKNTYDAILDEEKKKTIDVSSQDNALIKQKEQASDLYLQKKYLAAYKILREILQFEPDNFQCRSMKLKSLYYSNPANSSNYSELLADYYILSINSYIEPEVKEIIKVINMELGTKNE